MDPTASNGGKSPRSYALSGKIMLSAIVVLFAVVILIFVLHLYVRWHVIRRASRRIRRRRQLVFSGEISGPSAPSINGGLDPSIIATLPVMLCSDDDGGSECGECAVCLNEFKRGEKIRCLPHCAHSFHIECIDMWFDSHSTCPLCRAAVEAAGASDPPPSDSNAAEVRIQIQEAAAEGSSGQQEQMPGIQQPSKPAIIRMVLIRWLYRPAVSGADLDLERAGGESVRTMAPGSNPDR